MFGLEDQAENDDDDDDGALKCGTVRNLVYEMINHQSNSNSSSQSSSSSSRSKYGPYIEYLLRQPRGQIPSDYTLGGQKMVLEILGGLPRRQQQNGGRKVEQSLPPVDPVSWIEDDWYDGCAGSRNLHTNSNLGELATAQVVQRADDEWMIPIYDVYNHRNGQYYNTRSVTLKGPSGYRQIYARKDILPGQEIFNSYNLCDHCGGRKDGYGTPGTYFFTLVSVVLMF